MSVFWGNVGVIAPVAVREGGVLKNKGGGPELMSPGSDYIG